MKALVDARHFDELCKYPWYAIVSRDNYVSVAGDVAGSRVSLQRFVVSLETGAQVQDIKHVTFANKLQFDCRFENLLTQNDRRSVTQHRRPKKNSTSKFKGVRRRVRIDGGHSWEAAIQAPIGRVGLGHYGAEEEAAMVYDAAARQLFGETAYLNFPNNQNDPNAAQLADDRIQRFKIIQQRKAREKQAKA